MKTKSLLNAIKKTGLEINVLMDQNNLHVVRGSEYTLSWYVQGEHAVCVHVCRNGLESDTMTDYFPGFFPKTLKHAIEYVQKKGA